MRSADTMRARLCRRLGLDRNPLRRTSDRIEALLLLGLLTAFVPLAVLAAVSASHWAYASGVREQRADRARTQVTAVILQADPTAAGPPPEPGSAWLWVRARWTADGATHVGNVPAIPGTKNGSTIRIWVDSSGQVAPPPLTNEQLAGRVVLAEIAAPIGVAIGLLLLWRLLRWRLDRGRLAAWARAWSLVGPIWTRQR